MVWFLARFTYYEITLKDLGHVAFAGQGDLGVVGRHGLDGQGALGFRAAGDHQRGQDLEVGE